MDPNGESRRRNRIMRSQGENASSYWAIASTVTAVQGRATAGTTAIELYYATALCYNKIIRVDMGRMETARAGWLYNACYCHIRGGWLCWPAR
jgi:hypothetical protein